MINNLGYRITKRTLDLVVSVMTLFLFSPILIIIALLVRYKLGSPVFFRQERAGLNGVPFNICKFRTMTNTTDTHGELLPDADRLLPFGQFLRRTSLDELPQLFNVVRGDMSIVGPRPLFGRYIPLYTERQRRRLEVKPGITGLAQISGRNTLSWDNKFNMDVCYVENASFFGDLSILARTISKVLCRSGISQEGHATMPEFMGHEEDD